MKQSLEGYLVKNEKHLEQRNMYRNVLRDAPSIEMIKSSDYSTLQDFFLTSRDYSSLHTTDANSHRKLKTPPFIEVTGQQPDSLNTSRDLEYSPNRMYYSGSPSNMSNLSPTFDKMSLPRKNRVVTFKQMEFMKKSSITTTDHLQQQQEHTESTNDLIAFVANNVNNNNDNNNNNNNNNTTMTATFNVEIREKSY